MWKAAHDQPVVYEEGRGNCHPEADALVHVQLIGGPAKDAPKACVAPKNTMRMAGKPAWRS
jgi:hypothetical protein